MPDLMVEGAGAVGLSAAVKVARAGFSVQFAEAPGRSGGGMFAGNWKFADSLPSSPVDCMQRFDQP
jgi:ribulose 1,5-bisphosphate synthetase/thiazole synthase